MPSKAIRLAIVFVCAGCTSGPTAPPSKDQLLKQKVIKAVELRMSASTVERFVGLKSLVNTKTDEHGWEAFYSLEIDFDSDTDSDFSRCKHVVVWTRPLDAKFEIIGIAWKQNGDPEVFTGEVLGPSF